MQPFRRALIGAAEPLSYLIVKEFARPSDARRLFHVILPKPPTYRHSYYRLHFQAPVG